MLGNRSLTLPKGTAFTCALKTKVSTIDKRRIDAHLESVFALQTQIKALPDLHAQETQILSLG